MAVKAATKTRQRSRTREQAATNGPARGMGNKIGDPLGPPATMEVPGLDYFQKVAGSALELAYHSGNFRDGKLWIEIPYNQGNVPGGAARPRSGGAARARPGTS